MSILPYRKTGATVVEETSRIHGKKKQFEIKLGYHFAGGAAAKVYDVEVFLFLV